MRFDQEMAASLPPGLPLPAPFMALFRHMDEHGFVHRYSSGDDRYASLYPRPWQDGQSLVTFQPADADYVKAWTGSDDPAITARLATFCRTGGDGSFAALWRDDAGQIQIVHMGSGSGSTWLGIITANAIDFLRLLAIGYEELCWPENLGRSNKHSSVIAANPALATAEEPILAETPPEAFRAWLASNYRVAPPETGAAIVKSVALMGDVNVADPFHLWITALQAKRDAKP